MFFNYPESSLNLEVSGQLKVPIPAIAGISAALMPAHFAASCTHLDQDHSGCSSRRREGAGRKGITPSLNVNPARSSRNPCPFLRTQRITGSRPRPKDVHRLGTGLMVLSQRVNGSRRGQQEGGPRHQTGVKRFTNQVLGVDQPAGEFPFQPLLVLRKHLLLPIYLVISQDEVGRPGQLMSQRLMGDSVPSLVQFPIVKGPAERIITPGMIRSLRICPSQMPIPVSDIASTLDLIVAGPLARYQTTIGGILAHLGEPLNGTRLQQNAHRQNLSHPWQSQQVRKRLLHPDLLQHPSFDLLDLSAQTIYGLFAGSASQSKSLVSLQKRTHHVFGQPFNLGSLDDESSITMNHVLDAQQQSRSVPYQLQPLSQ